MCIGIVQILPVLFIYLYLVGLMKMGNTVPPIGIEPTSLAYRTSVLHDIDSLMSPLYPHLPVQAVPYLKGQCSVLHSAPHWNCKPLDAYNYIHTGNHLTCICMGQVQQPYSTQLVQDHGNDIQYRGCDENGKYCAQSRNRTHISGIPGQCATTTSTRLPDVTTIFMPTCLCGCLSKRSVQTTTYT